MSRYGPDSCFAAVCHAVVRASSNWHLLPLTGICLKPTRSKLRLLFIVFQAIVLHSRALEDGRSKAAWTVLRPN